MSERREAESSRKQGRRPDARPESAGGAAADRSANGDGGSWLDRLRDAQEAAPLTGGAAPDGADAGERGEAEDLPWSRPTGQASLPLPEPSGAPTPVPVIHLPGDAPGLDVPDAPSGPVSRAPVAAATDGSDLPEQTPGPALEASVGLSVARLRAAALEMARRDAEAGLPTLDAKGRSESEQELRDRCASLFRDWTSRQQDRLHGLISDKEGRITETLGTVALNVDRFERITTELFRLKKRQEVSRTLVESTLARAEGRPAAKQGTQEDESGEEATSDAADGGSRGFKTHLYALAITFLGVVEFLANSPVFGALLPRDPLTEQQIRFVAETSEGWLAGATRVVSQFVFRPDAALLAAGVVTFLCVLAHFFGHSLRRLLVHKASEKGGELVGNRSAMEFVVPMILSGIGLVFVLGVLYQARVTLGDVAVQRFAQDSAKVEELRRNASWLRVDGNLVAANEQANRADDLEALAKEQREYAMSMSGLSFPILLLNTTLVLVAISAAYFHMRDPRRDRFNEMPWERRRRDLIDLGDGVQERIGEGQGRLVRLIGELKALLAERPLKEAPALAHQLEATVVAYRAENGRRRGLDTRDIPAFADPVRLELTVGEPPAAALLRDPAEYEEERRGLVARFEEIRNRFTREATTW
ncbi:MAG: hypothetical protein RRA92_09100 [Gemmatimonadota bacterium]|nr:hypothetical protein [Gemmatimonadota bacterium]